MGPAPLATQPESLPGNSISPQGLTGSLSYQTGNGISTGSGTGYGQNSSGTLPPNSPSSSNSTSSPGVAPFAFNGLDKSGSSVGQNGSGTGLGNGSNSLVPTGGSPSLLSPSSLPVLHPYGTNVTGSQGLPMDKLSHAYSQSSAIGASGPIWPTGSPATGVSGPAPSSMPEWYQQMGYHQYYAQGGDPYGLNNSQVTDYILI